MSHTRPLSQVPRLRVILLAFVPALILTAPALGQAGRGYEGTITVEIKGQAAWADEDNPEEKRTQKVHRTARHSFIFDSSESFPGNKQGAIVIQAGVDGISAEVHDQWTHTRDGETSTRIKTGSAGVDCAAPGASRLAYLCMHGTVYMVIVPKERAYYFQFNTVPVPVRDAEGHQDWTTTVPDFEVGPIPLPPERVTRFAGTQVFDPWKIARSEKGTSFNRDYVWDVDEHVSNLQATVTWSFEPPDLPEVTIESDAYDQWIPEGSLKDPAKAGNTIAFRAKVHKRGDPAKPSDQKVRLTFQLEQVSTEKGICLNWPRNGSMDDDLQIVKAENGELEVTGTRSAKTKAEVSEATLVLSAFDFGAFGSLKVTARTAEGAAVPVKFQGKADASILVPRNDHGQRTANAWLKQKEKYGLPDEWDGLQVPRHPNAGDGLTLYAKYRGVVVLSGGDLEYRRLDPNRKCHFVLDENGIFPFARWERTTDTVAYGLDDELVDPQTRQVDFNGRHSGSGHKFAIRLTAVPGLIQTNPPNKDMMNYGYTVGRVSGNSALFSPRDTQQCCVFPDRMRALIDRLAESIKNGLANPASDDGRKLAAAGFGRTFTAEEVASRLAALTPAHREQLAQKMLATVTIHEMCHGVGIPGHKEWVSSDAGDGWQESPKAQNDASCPMQYWDHASRRQFALFDIEGGIGPICDLCARAVKLKD